MVHVYSLNEFSQTRAASMLSSIRNMLTYWNFPLMVHVCSLNQFSQTRAASMLSSIGNMLKGFHFGFLFWNYYRIRTFMPPYHPAFMQCNGKMKREALLEYRWTVKKRWKCLHLLDSQLPSLISLFIFIWSISEANPKNNWMRGEQACLGLPQSVLQPGQQHCYNLLPLSLEAS